MSQQAKQLPDTGQSKAELAYWKCREKNFKTHKIRISLSELQLGKSISIYIKKYYSR